MVDLWLASSGGVPLIVLLAFLLCLGGAAGFLAGLLGIGGGLVLVPGLYYGLTALGYPAADMMHVAVGTSLAVIIPTGLSSARAHWKRGAVRMDMVRTIGAGILVGVVLGTVLAAQISGDGLKIFFAMAVSGFAVMMFTDPARFRRSGDGPRPLVAAAGGTVIGTISTLMGVGGATMSVPFMTIWNIPVHKAVGTAAALGLVIAVPAALGFVVIGWGRVPEVPGMIGYVNMLAWLVIVPASVLAAPLGAHVAHSLSLKWLRAVFALFLLLVAARMIYSALA